MAAEEIRLDVGCGESPRPGYVGIDARNGRLAHELPYEDGTVDEIRASHVLEHYSHRSTLAVLQHWHAKLKPGGVVRIAVPDFDWIVNTFRGPKSAQYPLEAYILGGHVDEHDHHGAIFTYDKLAILLKHTGFCDIRRWKGDEGDCSALEVSLNVQARKPIQVPDAGKSIVAILSAPRTGMMENMASIVHAVATLGIPLMRSHGVFWGQCLTRLLSQAKASGARYALTIDYDSVFTADDVTSLYQIAEMHNLDMLCPVQVKREASNAMVYIRLEDGSVKHALDSDEVSADWVPITSGHFGLTLIRLEMLDKLPKPWFRATPDANGEWEDGHVDEDVSFWFAAKEIGARIGVAPWVKIGHEQRVVTWPDRNWSPLHQYMSEYAERGKPQEAR